jgi:serine/threonine protein kinase
MKTLFLVIIWLTTITSRPKLNKLCQQLKPEKSLADLDKLFFDKKESIVSGGQGAVGFFTKSEVPFLGEKLSSDKNYDNMQDIAIKRCEISNFNDDGADDLDGDDADDVLGDIRDGGESSSDNEKLARFKKELAALNHLKSSAFSGQISRLVSCYTNVDPPTEADIFYVVMEKAAGKPMNSEEILQTIALAGPDGIFIWLNVLRTIIGIHKSRFVHGDIKLENLIYDGNGNGNVKVIDFGCVATDGISSTLCGTYNYWSPNKLSRNLVSLIDDIFAWVMAMFATYAAPEKGFCTKYDCNCSVENSEIQLRTKYDSINKTLKPIPDNCFEGTRTHECKVAIIKNIKRVFRKAGFGSYAVSGIDNFTSLFVDIIKFDQEHLTYTKIIRRLVDIIIGYKNENVENTILDKIKKLSNETSDHERVLNFLTEFNDELKSDCLKDNSPISDNQSTLNLESKIEVGSSLYINSKVNIDITAHHKKPYYAISAYSSDSMIMNANDDVDIPEYDENFYSDTKFQESIIADQKVKKNFDIVANFMGLSIDSNINSQNKVEAEYMLNTASNIRNSKLNPAENIYTMGLESKVAPTEPKKRVSANKIPPLNKFKSPYAKQVQPETARNSKNEHRKSKARLSIKQRDKVSSNNSSKNSDQKNNVTRPRDWLELLVDRLSRPKHQINPKKLLNNIRSSSNAILKRNSSRGTANSGKPFGLNPYLPQLQENTGNGNFYLSPITSPRNRRASNYNGQATAPKKTNEYGLLIRGPTNNGPRERKNGTLRILANSLKIERNLTVKKPEIIL